jgi:hypothetical protein
MEKPNTNARGPMKKMPTPDGTLSMKALISIQTQPTGAARPPTTSNTVTIGHASAGTSCGLGHAY